ncbi:YlaI family protein [Priestia megaterium]|uniref:YlaI family protein n=1 Tax=Priestia TaxID=2800373 RepID=UPI0021AC292D|nr:YlaI family protein [Priestia megaterium]MCR8929313.1 YlaI family protein [Priestia megaterium]
MRVQCVMCDKIETIEDETLVAKRLRNRPIHTYMCNECAERIEKRTKERIATGNFKLYESKKTEEDW